MRILYLIFIVLVVVAAACVLAGVVLTVRKRRIPRWLEVLAAVVALVGAGIGVLLYTHARSMW